jgi:hypothetical protein
MKILLKIVFLAVIPVFVVSCAFAPPVFESKSPAFSVQYPLGWQKDKPRIEAELLYVYTGEFKVPTMNVSKADMTASPDEYAKATCEFLKNTYGSPSCRVLYAKKSKLADGTLAYEAELEWRWPGWNILYTCSVVAKKGDTSLSVSMTDLERISEDYKKFLYNISIK